jgi:hypothetical protein
VATQIIKKLLDDLDGGDADETIQFAFEGSAYTIDLNAKHAKEFKEFMAKYQEAGTRLGRAVQPPVPGPVRQTFSAAKPAASLSSDREQNKAIREWALKNGYELADRGRIPQSIQDAFQSNTPNPAWAAAQRAKALEAEMAASTRKPATAEKPAAQKVTAPRKRAGARASA